MDPQKKKIIWAMCLIGFLGFFGYYQYKSAFPELDDSAGGTPAAGTDAKSAADKTDATAVADEPVVIDREKIMAALDTASFVYDFTNLRDPMVPVIYAPDPDETGPEGDVIAVSRAHILDGIVWDPYEPLASIDNTVVAVGETLADGSVVQSISPDKVILSTDSGTFSVGFYEE